MTKELVTITNDAYITSTQVCELLKKLATTTALPITLVLDNARYQRCKLVMDLAETLVRHSINSGQFWFALLA